MTNSIQVMAPIRLYTVGNDDCYVDNADKPIVEWERE